MRPLDWSAAHGPRKHPGERRSAAPMVRFVVFDRRSPTDSDGVTGGGTDQKSAYFAYALPLSAPPQRRAQLSKALLHVP